MEAKSLAKFYNISAQAVGRWSVEKRKQKTVQALSGAEQPVVDLIADISKLVFIFNCKWLHGEKQVKVIDLHIECFRLDITGTEFWLSFNIDSVDAEERLCGLKTKLEELVYGL